VIDLFQSGGRRVAVAGHVDQSSPEAFEYQIRPEPAWLEPQQGEVPFWRAAPVWLVM